MSTAAAPAHSHVFTYVPVVRWAVLLTVMLAMLMGSAHAQDRSRDKLSTVKKLIAEKKAVLIDVREEREWQDGHLRDAKLLPLSVLEKGLSKEKLVKIVPENKIVYLHCASGARCMDAADILREKGFEVHPLRSDYEKFLQAGFEEVMPEPKP